MENIKLQPCPFCGNEDITVYDLDYTQQVHCKECHANIGVHKINYSETRMQSVIERWNRRVNHED